MSESDDHGASDLVLELPKREDEDAADGAAGVEGEQEQELFLRSDDDHDPLDDENAHDIPYEVELDTLGGDATEAREAVLDVGREPLRVEREAARADIFEDVEEVVPEEVREHEAVAELRGPSGLRIRRAQRLQYASGIVPRRLSAPVDVEVHVAEADAWRHPVVLTVLREEGTQLLVGGIGVMNIQLVSVAERTQEIGIRSAIGASPRQIMVQFLAEAVVLSFTGSLAGVGLGWLASALVAQAMAWSGGLSIWMMIGAAAFGTSVGVAFGYLPAKRAAQLEPIDALRHE